MTNRRQFILTLVPAVALIGATGLASAAPVHVQETDPGAAALNYKKEATTVDKKKFPAYVAGSMCSNCQLYQGKAGDAAALCPIMGGKWVESSGWCSAYNKKS